MPLTAAEALAAGVTSVAAATILFTYLCDRVGIPFTPATVLPFTVALAIATVWCLRRQVHRWQESRAGELVAVLVVCGGLFGWLQWLAAPSGLPIGGGDLTHHLQLIDYLERHWRLIHDPGLVEPYLGEMVHYTPGVHVLSALVGHWLSGDGLHAVHGVVAFSIALKTGFVMLVSLRVLAGHRLRTPLAVASACALLLPYPYVLESFLRDSFLAQVMSECFAVAMWWALLVWDDACDDAAKAGNGEPSPWPMGFFALFGCAAFLTWPIWVGPPCVALGLTLLLRRRPALAVRIRHGALALLPLGALAAIYLAGRVSQLGMSGAAGAVMHPSVDAYSVVLLGLASGGLMIGAVAAARPRVGSPHTRTTMFLVFGIALQAGVLYLQAMATGNTSAYMAFKTLYLTPYPMAVLAAVTLAFVGDRLRCGPHIVPAAVTPPVAARTPRAVAWTVAVRMAVRMAVPVAVWMAVWLMVALLGVHAAVRLRSTRRPPPALTDAMLHAGAWAREHLPRGCIAYMVPDDDTSYWLHLAVLRNPRMSPRSGDLATYSMGQTIVRWFSPGDGLPYAIADLAALSRDVREDLDVIARFDSAAVVRRRGPSACADDALPPPP